jgi:hypothetical protein
MVLGMSLQSFTLLHVLISLVGIASGFAVLYGFFAGKRLNSWTVVFLTTTALTSITGFLFPFKGITPGIKVGILSLAVLAIAIVARYSMHLKWRKTYVISACAALYFNVFVLVVQSFEKAPALHALAPTQKEAPFVVTQVAVFVLFVVVTAMAASKFRLAPTMPAESAPRAKAA